MIGHITSPAAVGGLERRELTEPEPEAHDTMISVRAYSVNRGELGLLERRPDGWRPGQDVAGIVVAQAADGTGPGEGIRVASHADGGSWSEFVNVPSHRVAPIPDNVSFADAAGLPAAGLTALRALRSEVHCSARTSSLPVLPEELAILPFSSRHLEAPHR
jgi:NADPH:quinone reductase-like Zn-dependent oxidoreductase